MLGNERSLIRHHDEYDREGYAIIMQIDKVVSMILDLEVKSGERLVRTTQVSHAAYGLIIYNINISNTDKDLIEDTQSPCTLIVWLVQRKLEIRYILRIGKRSA